MSQHYYQGVFPKVFQRKDQLPIFNDLSTFADEYKSQAAEYGGWKKDKRASEYTVMQIDGRVYTAQKK